MMRKNLIMVRIFLITMRIFSRYGENNPLSEVCWDEVCTSLIMVDLLFSYSCYSLTINITLPIRS